MHVAIYARVSTVDKGQDVENQLAELRTYCSRMSYTIHKEYCDTVSGSKGKALRPMFDEMMRDSSRAKFQGVLVWSLDRFTREGISETFGYLAELKVKKVVFISYTEEHFRTTGPTGDILIAIAAWVAQQERKRIQERVRAGLAVARAKGVRLGRPKVGFNEAKALEMLREGKGDSWIAKELGTGRMNVARWRGLLKSTPLSA